MDADEQEICLYLKGFPGQFIGLTEITRRAGGKSRYREDENWAVPVLNRLVERGFVESDSTGHYRLKAKARDKEKTKWVSPQIRKILEKSGKDFGEAIKVDDPTEIE